MENLKSIEQVWEELKHKKEHNKLVLESADKTLKIIDKIKEARENLGISQRELAQKCGLQQSSLARIETYKVVPKLNTLIKIAEAVNVTIVAYNMIEQYQIKYLTLLANTSTLQYSTHQGEKYGYKY